MRQVLEILTGLCCAACLPLLLLGVVFVLIGDVEQDDADNTYVVGFVPGADCDDDNELYLDVEDGAVLDCVRAGWGGSGVARVPGFTDDQDQQVQDLADRLGNEGLSKADRHKIQHLVDRIAAKVPPSERPYHDYTLGIWGDRRIWVGVGMVVVAVVGGVGLLWLVIRMADPKRAAVRSSRRPGTR